MSDATALDDDVKPSVFRVRLDPSLVVPVAQMSFKGTPKAQSVRAWKLEVMAKLEAKYNCLLDPSECVLVDNNTNQVIMESIELKGVDLIQLTLKKITPDSDEKEDTGHVSDDDNGKRNIASRLRKSVLITKKRLNNSLTQPVDIEAGNFKRFEADLERYNRLKSGHAKVLESVSRYFETAAAHVEASIKLQEDLRIFFKRSSRSECNEEFKAFHDLRMSVLEKHKKTVDNIYTPMVTPLKMLKELDGLKQQHAACTDALAEINKQKRAIAISKASLDSAMKNPTSDIESKSVVHGKMTQDLEALFSDLEKHEIAFEHAMDDFDAVTSFSLLRDMCGILASSIVDSKFTVDKMGGMEAYLEQELPSVLVKYEDDYEKTRIQREAEEQKLKETQFQDIDLSEEKQHLQPSDPPLLQAEKIAHTATNVMNLGQRVLCVLVLTNYRLIAIPYTHTRARKRDPRTIDIPLMCIVRLESTGDAKGLLSIWLGDLRHYVFGFSQQLKTEISKFANVLRYFVFQIPKPFAFTLRTFSFAMIDNNVPDGKGLDIGWSVYDVEAEYARQGAIKMLHGSSMQSSQFRLTTLNRNFLICSTYPEQIVVPVDMLDSELKESADHRTRNRLPVLSWKHPSSRVALFRGSQPKMGVTRSRKKADEKLLLTLGSCTRSEEKDGDSGPLALPGKKMDGYPDCNLQSLRSFITPSTTLVIFDARPYKNAVGNVAKGGGWELPDYYTNCVCVFCDIENIHEVRGALQALRNTFDSLPQRPFEPLTFVLDPLDHHELGVIQNFVRELDACYRRMETDALYLYLLKGKPRWYKHVSLLLKAGLLMSETIHELRLSAFSHCSDGWDRTAQLTCLTTLLLDPFYRTIKGFAVLIEKEWVSFGHKFSERMGLGAPPDKLAAKRSDFGDSQRSPIFLQWVDCVFQILRQFPHAFEFNALFLADLMDHIHSCRFGTFLGNCAKDRTEAMLKQRTVSLWTFVFSARIRPYYENPDFVPTLSALKPKCEVEDMVLFLPLYQRWDSSLPPPFSLVAADGSFEFLVIDDDGTVVERSESFSKSDDSRPSAMSLGASESLIDDISPPTTPRAQSPSRPPPGIPTATIPSLHPPKPISSPSRPPPPVPIRAPSTSNLLPSDRAAAQSGSLARGRTQPRSASMSGFQSAVRRG